MGILTFQKADHKLRSPQDNFPNYFFFFLIEVLKLLLLLLEVQVIVFGLPGADNAA